MTAISSEWKVDNGGSHLTLVTLLVLRKTKQYQVLIQVYTHTDTHTGTRNLCWFLKYISSGMKEHPDVNLVVSWFFQDIRSTGIIPQTKHTAPAVHLLKALHSVVTIFKENLF